MFGLIVMGDFLEWSNALYELISHVDDHFLQKSSLTVQIFPDAFHHAKKKTWHKFYIIYVKKNT